MLRTDGQTDRRTDRRSWLHRTRRRLWRVQKVLQAETFAGLTFRKRQWWKLSFAGINFCKRGKFQFFAILGQKWPFLGRKPDISKIRNCASQGLPKTLLQQKNQVKITIFRKVIQKNQFRKRPILPYFGPIWGKITENISTSLTHISGTTQYFLIL